MRASGVTGLLTNFTSVPDEPGLALVQATIQLSAHVLADPDQLPAPARRADDRTDRQSWPG